MSVDHGANAGFLNIRWFAGMLVATLLAAIPLAKVDAEAFAQPAAGGGEVRGQPSPEDIKKAEEAAKAAAAAGQQPGAKPGEAKPEEGKKPEGEGDKKKEGGDAVKRPDKPPRAPDPREFDVVLDANGNVPPFNFIGQPWQDVMQWLATQSNASLDWLELPTGYLNLTTQRAYKLDEVHDLINQSLNARGYTAIQFGELLSVYKIEKLDPSVVKQVNEEDLYNLKRYDFVKVSFELPEEMEVDKAKEDVKQVVSPHAKVFPLVTARKLLIMDSVANLRTVSELLNQERMIADGRIVPKNFPLKYARPDQVIETLYVILGVDPKAKPAQMTPEQQQQQQMMEQQMRQQGQNPKVAKPQAGPQVYLAYNRQLNSVMANAPAKEMKIIEQTIALLDVPFGGEALTATADNGRSMKKYPLTTLDPENFMQTLKEIGNLSPYAEFKVDTKSKTLFALATVQDHEKINGMIDQFDGTGRQFEVVWLRRLPADAVAATIFKLMAGQQEEEENDNDRYRWWDYGRGNDEEKEKPQQGFGVDADIENNRLLLWANEAEMERVRDLLAKLGELPTGQADQRPVRFIEPSGEQANAELLQRIKDAWAATGGNELIIKAPPPKAPEADKKKEDESKKEGKSDDAKDEKKPAADREAAIFRAPRVAAHFAQLGTTTEQAADPKAPAQAAQPVENAPPVGEKADTAAPAAPSAETSPPAEVTAPSETPAATQPATAPANSDPSAAPPITVTVTEDGRIMLSSPDTAALDRMEELIGELSPPDKRFRVYRLQHIPALHMYWDLDDYFKEDLEEESDGYVRDWYGFMMPKNGNKNAATGLAKRRKLMITYDVPSNSILVANASASQLAEIESLIEEFDRPAPTDSAEIRQTENIKIHYSRPSVIAAAIKEVYRDLLSSRDKEFDRGDGNKGENQRGSAERVTILNYGGGGGSSDESSRSSVKVGFDGALSLGADDISGVLIVSAQKGIFENIVRMVRELDAEAAPQTTVRVHRVNGNVSAAALQDALADAVGTNWLGDRPEQTGSTNDGDRRGDNDRRDRDRDRDRDRGDRRNRDNNNNNDND